MWKKLSSKELLIHPRITVLEDKVVLPDGTKTEYLHFKHEYNSSAVIAERSDGKILLQKEYFYPLDDYLWMFPGGLIGLDEDPKIGANRELREETGYTAKKLELVGTCYTLPRRSQELLHIYHGTDLVKGITERETSEEIPLVMWLTPVEIDKLVQRNDFDIAYTLAIWALYCARNRRG